jgi:DNA recombination protein RmuC
MGESLEQSAEKTALTMASLQERLAVIDTAQRNITALSEQVVSLQDILANKQARGAFGEIQMGDIVTAALPPSAYEFQKTLANGRRADCLVLLPDPPGPIVIDAKFPLESYAALRNAGDEAAKTLAERALRADVLTHVKAIAERYICPGETAESALMFLPSEAIYAELHANFRDVVEKSYRQRVWIVSPTTLMATLNTVRAVLKDVRMREQAGLIQKEVLALTGDVGRLQERVEKLKTHFSQAEGDIRQIDTSADKILRRAGRIEEVQLGDLPDSSPTPAKVESLFGTGE